MNTKIVKRVAICVLILLCLGGMIKGLNHPRYIGDMRFFPKEAAMKMVYGMADSKVWAHRVDSIGKLREQVGTFEGVEFDLTYFDDESEFDVSHDKQERLEYPLEDFFAEIDGSDIKLWLDYKNLTSKNSEASRARLNELLTKYHIAKQNVIVESHNVQELGAFHRDGFYTSYYVPVNKKYLETEAGKDEFAHAVRTAIATGNVNAVSFPVEYYDMVSSITQDEDVDKLMWDMGARWWNYNRQNERKIRLADERTKVVLVTSESRYTR